MNNFSHGFSNINMLTFDCRGEKNEAGKINLAHIIYI
jgi:hypothetical protein